MIILNNLTARLTKFKGEINTKPSETIPDQSVTPQELLRRYATGQPLGFKACTPVYDDDETDIPELYKMDKLDRLHALQNNSRDLHELSTEFQQQQHKLEQKQKQKQQQKIDASQHAKHEEKSEPVSAQPE